MKIEIHKPGKEEYNDNWVSVETVVRNSSSKYKGQTHVALRGKFGTNQDRMEKTSDDGANFGRALFPEEAREIADMLYEAANDADLENGKITGAYLYKNTIVITGFARTDKKISLIKAIRAVSGLGLKESKAFVEDVIMGKTFELCWKGSGHSLEEIQEYLTKEGIFYEVV